MLPELPVCYNSRLVTLVVGGQDRTCDGVLRRVCVCVCVCRCLCVGA